jgi:hypothetical protein
MPPKIQSKGRTVAEPSFAKSTIQALTSPDNRSIISAIGMFAVSISLAVSPCTMRYGEELELDHGLY